MPLAPGSSLGSYTIVAPLGTGGMGEVYRAHDPRLGRDVALKVLPADMARDPSRLERFTREARAIAALNHPHIVTIYSTEEADGIRFLTMELVEGQPLDALIPANGMPLARFLELAVPLADALHAAHQKQITHRDLKPANVMVARDGRLKVLDFGLASAPSRHLGTDSLMTSPQVTTPGTIIGTMPYMSPEQVEGKQLDHRTDLFSLGVMFHEMLVGTRPFSGESSPQLMSAILRDTPSSTSDLRGDVPEPLSRLVARCLEKQPDDRVQTARDIYNELRHVQKQLESGPRPKPDSGSAPAAMNDSLWLAVLPFTTRGTDPDGVSLAAGLTEDITAGLALFPSLSVVALQSARSFKDSPLDVRQIAERLNARYVMGGSVRKSASGIRVAAQLIDARSGAQLWTETYTRGAGETDIYAVQDDITDRVVSTVADKNGVLARSMVQAIRGIPIEQLSARQLVYRCWGAQLSPMASQHEEVRAALESVVTRQPDDAELWAHLSQCYVFEHSLFFNPRPDPLVRARRAARRAIELDPSNQEGWLSLGLAGFFARDEAGLLEAVDRVLRLNPRASNSVAWMGCLLTHTGAYDHGCQITERAMALNASHAGWYHFAPFNRAFGRGDFDEALKSARRVNIAGFHFMHIAIAAAAGHLGLSGEGAAAIEALHTVAPPLADEHNLREMIIRWYWEEEMIESLLEGLRRSKSPPPAADATPVRSRPRSSPAAAAPAGRPPSGHAAADGTWIAVIPFTSVATDEDARTLADGLTEDITAGLSRFPYLSVVAEHSARQHKDTTADVRQIGNVLGARYLLDGGIRRGGASIRITARLVDAGSGAQLWSETYTREPQGNLLAIQDDVTDRVVATVADVHGVLLRSASAGVRGVPIEQLTPEELRLRYWSYHRQHAPIEHGLLRDHFERLVEAQPVVAPFWAVLSHLCLHEYGFGFNVKPEPLRRARHAVDRALELDSLNQHAWEALAFTLFFEQDREGFAHAVDRVLALNPRNANATALMGILFVHAGELERGGALADRAIAINPDHPGWYHIARASADYALGRFESALRFAKRINMPQHLWAHALVAMASAQLGRTAEALAALETLLALEPGFADEAVMAAAARRWKWLPEQAEQMVDGYRQAMALRREAALARPPSDAATAAPLTRVASPALTSDLAIAVRLFSSRGGESADALAEGLTDDVTAGLSRFSYLRVVPRAVAEATLPPARYVLEGQVRRAHPHLRISARLNDTVSGATLWAENFDRAADVDTFQLQDEVAPRIIATVADANGVLLRSMVATLKQRPIEEHTVSDLVVRFNGFLEHFDPAEHAVIRDRLSALLLKEPGHADGWACLSSLIEHEVSQGLNPQPDSLKRARECAERSIAANPVCQEGWCAMASAAFFARDAAGVRVAAERAIAINPLNTATVAVCGMFIGYSGAWDRGLEVVRHAMQPNPHYPGWLHFPFFSYHYIRREYAEALERVKQVNMPRFAKLHLCMAAVAGQLGLRDEARMALEALSRTAASSPDDGYARRSFTAWLWREEDIDHHVEGVRKARALVAGEAGG